MWNSQSASPCRELRSYVRAYGQRETKNVFDIVQPSVACLEPTLSLDFQNPTYLEFDHCDQQAAPKLSLVGPQTRRQGNVWLKGHMNTFGVFFQPLGCWQLFRVPPSLLVNRFYSAEELIGRGVRQLWERMGESQNFERRVALMEAFLLQRAATASECTPFMMSALHSFREHGTLPVSALAHDTALSVRQFERSFLRDVGVSPKLFGRIARYQRALDAKLMAPQRSWLNIAHHFGYHDQMHMIRDFQSLNGASPTKTILQIGDLRPEALAGADSSRAAMIAPAEDLLMAADGSISRSARPSD